MRPEDKAAKKQLNQVLLERKGGRHTTKAYRLRQQQEREAKEELKRTLSRDNDF